MSKHLIIQYESDFYKKPLKELQKMIYEEIKKRNENCLYIAGYRVYDTSMYSTNLKYRIHFSNLDERLVDEKDLNQFGTIYIYQIKF